MVISFEKWSQPKSCETHNFEKKPIYYIIGYEDNQHTGWTVWERVVLYGSIYAENHKMIPVVDMQNHSSIYQEDKDFGIVNTWEQFYEQPNECRVGVAMALKSENYVLGDISHEWFTYLRMRRPNKLRNEEFLREKYSQYIKLKPDIVRLCDNRLNSIKPDKSLNRYLAICVRGTDYKEFHHMKQPSVSEIAAEARNIYEKYNCDYYFIATEDEDIFMQLKELLPSEKVIAFKAGNIKSDSKGLVGDIIRKTTSAYDAALDYITTLYILNKSVCLIGGVCGATIVAKYRRNPPYEYIDIKDLYASY